MTADYPFKTLQTHSTLYLPRQAILRSKSTGARGINFSSGHSYASNWDQKINHSMVRIVVNFLKNTPTEGLSMMLKIIETLIVNRITFRLF